MEFNNIFDNENNFAKYKSIESNRIISNNLLDKPFLSIMIPTFKRFDLLKFALQSLIEQDTRYPFEIVVIDNDDSGNQNIKNLITEFNDNRISYYRNEKNIGMFGNWNRCIELANAEWLVILNDDDMLNHKYIEYMCNTIEHLCDADALSCGLEYINENGNKISRTFLRRISHKLNHFFSSNKISRVRLNDLFYDYITPIHGCMIRKISAIRLGGFNEKYYPISDAVFMLRLADKFNLYCVGKKLYKYRVFENESLKHETLKGFVVGKAYMRNEILLRLRLNNNYFYKVIKNFLLDYDILNYDSIKIADKTPLSYAEVKEIKLKFSDSVRVSSFFAYLSKILVYFNKYLFWIKAKKR